MADDEISMVGAQQFHAMSEPLEIVTRVLGRRAHKGRSRSTIDGDLEAEPANLCCFVVSVFFVVGYIGQVHPSVKHRTLLQRPVNIAKQQPASISSAPFEKLFAYENSIVIEARVFSRQHLALAKWRDDLL